MHKTILETIRTLRSGKSYAIDRRNSNRYRVVLGEDDASKTAYYFSTPIYQEESGRVVPLQFESGGNAYLLKGSNCNISIGQEEIKLTGKNGIVTWRQIGQGLQLRGTALYGKGIEIHPTLNGIAVKIHAASDGISIPLHTSKPFYDIRANTKYFALMQEPFQPFMVLSGIGAFLDNGTLGGPLRMSFQKTDDKDFTVWISSTTDSDRVLWFELNLYEPKLFQDTTVESKNPGENNAFGTTAYLGQSESFGEQWLYMRPDLSVFSDLSGKHINSAFLYVPTYSQNAVRLRGIGIPQRFCSFGSNWQNKIAPTKPFAYGTAVNGYYQLDLSRVLTDPDTNMLHRTDGWILRTVGNGYTAISTADSFFSPQILVINYT